jgi:hypothetical protein
MGPMTGRKAGYCSGAARPGYTNGDSSVKHPHFLGRRGAGMNLQAGSGYGRSYGMNSSAIRFTNEPNSEKDYFEQEISLLNGKLRELEQRLSEKNSKV